MTKNELRHFCKTKRKELSVDGNALCEIIKSFSAFQNCDTILCYYPIGSEVNILPIIEYAAEKGKKLAFPRCISQTETEFYFINSLSELTPGMYRIPEPTTGNRLSPEYTEAHNCITLVPGLCFDKCGNRLGYGKGYYDRFLPKIRSVNIGICHSQLISDKIPCGENDYKMDYILCEKGVIKADEI